MDITPRWIRDLKRLLPIRSQFVVAGNIRDSFLVPLASGPTLVRDGQIVHNRGDAYLLPAKADLIQGRVEGHPDGFGFVRRDDAGPDIFLGPKEMRAVLHGDRVMVRIAGQDRRGRPEGKVVSVLERAKAVSSAG